MFNGAKLYNTILFIGNLPNASTKVVSHNVAHNYVVRANIFSRATYRVLSAYDGITDVICNASELHITTDRDMSGVDNCYLWLEYAYS